MFAFFCRYVNYKTYCPHFETKILGYKGLVALKQKNILLGCHYEREPSIMIKEKQANPY